MIRFYILKLFSKVTSMLLSLLKNNQTVDFSREEIRWLKYSFSQFGEDLIIKRFLRKLNPSDGIYVDCGAFDPIAISNTLLLNKIGYKGINIDLDCEKISKFNLARPNDCNIVAALFDQKTKVNIFRYEGRATNRITQLELTHVKSILGEKPISSSVIETTTLTDIINSTKFKNTPIHYLNIDCEGLDIEILRGLDFSQYQPKVISIEVHSKESKDLVYSYLSDRNYNLSGLTDCNLIFTLKTLQW